MTPSELTVVEKRGLISIERHLKPNSQSSIERVKGVNEIVWRNGLSICIPSFWYLFKLWLEVDDIIRPLKFGELVC
jgi:hypothetical protein